MEYARRLIHVPILHSSADMGAMGEELETAYVERFGRRHWDEHLTLLNGFWQAVRTGLEQANLDYHQVDLYQDGLPVCGKELEIVKKAAAQGSENYQLLVDLVDRGATLIGTEDPRLLLEEYRNIQAALNRSAGTDHPSQPSTSAAPPADLMAKRDAYIAWRIGRSLGLQRTGILFLGLLHQIEALLPTDIVVTRLVPPTLERKAPTG